MPDLSRKFPSFLPRCVIFPVRHITQGSMPKSSVQVPPYTPFFPSPADPLVCSHRKLYSTQSGGSEQINRKVHLFPRRGSINVWISKASGVFLIHSNVFTPASFENLQFLKNFELFFLAPPHWTRHVRQRRGPGRGGSQMPGEHCRAGCRAVWLCCNCK